jgi:hypothetical protein
MVGVGHRTEQHRLFVGHRFIAIGVRNNQGRGFGVDGFERGLCAACGNEQ